MPRLPAYVVAEVVEVAYQSFPVTQPSYSCSHAADLRTEVEALIRERTLRSRRSKAVEGREEGGVRIAGQGFVVRWLLVGKAGYRRSCLVEPRGGVGFAGLVVVRAELEAAKSVCTGRVRLGLALVVGSGDRAVAFEPMVGERAVRTQAAVVRKNICLQVIAGKV